MKIARLISLLTLLLATLHSLAQSPTPSPEATPSPSASQTAPAPSPSETPPPSPANSQQEESFASSYKNGIQFYQAKQFDKAREAFMKALMKEPHNASALTNLALAQYKLGQKGWAIALLRRALDINPDQPTAKAALQFALSQLEVKEIPHQIETYETLRADFLQPVTLNVYLGLSALLLLACGWTFLSYWGRRRKALQEEESLPSFPLLSFLFGLAFLISLSLTLLKAYDQTLIRGTIVKDKVSVQAAPGENQVALFDLYGGFEVLVRTKDKEWVQVTYPGASTGWIPASALMVTSGNQ